MTRYLVNRELTRAQEARLWQLADDDPEAKVVDYTLDVHLALEPHVQRATGSRLRQRVTRGGRLVRAGA